MVAGAGVVEAVFAAISAALKSAAHSGGALGEADDGRSSSAIVLAFLESDPATDSACSAERFSHQPSGQFGQLLTWLLDSSIHPHFMHSCCNADSAVCSVSDSAAFKHKERAAMYSNACT